jgi:GntR family transcriptional regulator/MocR family aminotransferase
VDAAELAQMARGHGVLIEPGDVFFISPPYPCRHFRLRLSSIPAGQIAAGVRALSLAADELARARGATRRSTPPLH